MTAIPEESWERAFRAVKSGSPKYLTSAGTRKFTSGISVRSKYFCEFVNWLWQIFNIPMSSNCGGRYFGKASWFKFMQQVLNGNFVLVYGSPECLLSTESWRSIFDCESFKNVLIGVAFDEAYCITQWYVAIICNLLIKRKINVAFYS